MIPKIRGNYNLNYLNYDDIIEKNQDEEIMGEKLPDNEMELYRRIDEILHYMWDPIGIAGEPSARDEYYVYLPEAFQLAKRENSEDRIARYLEDIQVNRMGYPHDLKRCKEIAEIIVKWSKFLGFHK